MFLIGLNDRCYQYSVTHDDNAYEWFWARKVRPFAHYLYSFKKLEVEIWFDKSDIEKLFDDDNTKDNISGYRRSTSDCK